MEKVKSKKIMRETNIGEEVAFPISSLETVRNNVYLLNTKFYLQKKRWESVSNKEEGLVTVRRIS